MKRIFFLAITLAVAQNVWGAYSSLDQAAYRLARRVRSRVRKIVDEGTTVIVLTPVISVSSGETASDARAAFAEQFVASLRGHKAGVMFVDERTRGAIVDQYRLEIEQTKGIPDRATRIARFSALYNEMCFKGFSHGAIVVPSLTESRGVYEFEAQILAPNRLTDTFVSERFLVSRAIAERTRVNMSVVYAADRESQVDFLPQSGGGLARSSSDSDYTATSYTLDLEGARGQIGLSSASFQPSQQLQQGVEYTQKQIDGHVEGVIAKLGSVGITGGARYLQTDDRWVVDLGYSFIRPEYRITTSTSSAGAGVIWGNWKNGIAVSYWEERKNSREGSPGAQGGMHIFDTDGTRAELHGAFTTEQWELELRGAVLDRKYHYDAEYFGHPDEGRIKTNAVRAELTRRWKHAGIGLFATQESGNYRELREGAYRGQISVSSRLAGVRLSWKF